MFMCFHLKFASGLESFHGFGEILLITVFTARARNKTKLAPSFENNQHHQENHEIYLLQLLLCIHPPMLLTPAYTYQSIFHVL